ncbi:MAG: hypothetical protein A2107_03015 [Verrucomicrobia bacterium GWF2_62_7]|nr:MAG: hypothetical protein A2107_03015 [Verrucomicrobia bacterium GWF2_62_7]
MKTINMLLVTALLTGTVYAAGGKKAEDKDAWKKKVFTAEELAKCDGKEGRPVYAAVDGIVYDLTKSKYWKTGTHMKQHEAGADLTRDIKEKAPQGIHKGGKILNKMPKVGITEEYAKKNQAVKPAEKKEEKPAGQAAEKKTDKPVEQKQGK